MRRHVSAGTQAAERDGNGAPIAASSFGRRYGPWAVVTGASDGIGREFAIQLAARGLNLVLVARRGPVLEKLAQELADKHGIACRVIPTDLADASAVEGLVQATADLDVGIVVAAAGFGRSGPLIDAPLSDEIEMLAVNCTAVLAVAWHYGRRMAARGSGGLVLLSSLLGFAGVPRAANYAATKAYVQSLAEGLHRELAPLGVDVISSAPGPVRSGFGGRADMQLSATTTPEAVARATLRALGRRTTVRPGALSKLLGVPLALLPRPARVLALSRVMKTLTAHQPVGPTAAGR
ncbi:SDR family NAD(P)-dependent oxidoreductase [Mycobacterium spongiae]|uniref:SDR family NAD(P)-dependent oxidoreductase n=1 Tax=Mycobacterium spongiae TaxID=886343 RepID=A0A975PWZ0_9MYCO|nr:SDR family NAD(P)-dependent oxidoreductase [Mycobacterium spongiae]QUR67259.1 SDR family NAD(P)-dependent oxidoreductase [Mycobacterium spongiae]